MMPGRPNPKNAMLSPAANDLGLGAELVKQVAELEAERKKKLSSLNPQGPLLGAAQSLFGSSPYG
jgi:hypothetical protein